MPRPTSPKPPPRLSASSQASYEKFYVEQYPEAVSFARNVLHAGSAAEDDAQEAFMRCFTAWGVVECLAGPQQVAFLRTVTRHIHLDALRHAANHPGGAPASLDGAAGDWSWVDGEPTPYGETLPDLDPSVDPERALLAKEALEGTLDAYADGHTGLGALEVALYANAYPVEQVTAMLHQAAADHPDDDSAPFYRAITTRTVATRRSKRIAAWGRLRHARSDSKEVSA